MVTYFANDWVCNFDKLKEALTFMDTILFYTFAPNQFSELCSKAYNRLQRALMGFNWQRNLRLKWSIWCSMSHQVISDRWRGSLDTISIWPGNTVLSLVYSITFFVFSFLFCLINTPFFYYVCLILVLRTSYASIFWKKSYCLFFWCRDLRKLHYFDWFWSLVT